MSIPLTLTIDAASSLCGLCLILQPSLTHEVGDVGEVG